MSYVAYAAYAGVQKATESSRDLEIRAISFITAQMVNANKPDADPMARIRALNGNLRLWALLTADLSNPDNPLPDALKRSYISIGAFVRRNSLAAMDNKLDLALLIHINADLLDALGRQSPESPLPDATQKLSTGGPLHSYGSVL